MEELQIILHKLRFVFAGTLILIIIVLGSLTISTMHAAQSSTASNAGSSLIQSSSSANVITAGLSNFVQTIQEGATQTLKAMQDASIAFGNAISGGARATWQTLTHGARSVAHGISTGVQAVGSGIASLGKGIANTATRSTAFIGRSAGSSAYFIATSAASNTVYLVNTPYSLGSLVAETAHIQSFIAPASAMEIPVIDPQSPELQAALAALPAGTEQSMVGGPVWPMHGAVTTEFGVPHRPYQDTHTGIDIADGARPGTTSVHPFRPGRVIDVQRSNRGLGNHVIVDHGNGVTSVYAHLHTIHVEVAQIVDLGTILGTEGTTGVSTGTHLHFEIRVNGQAADPRQFIGGQP